MHTTRGCVPILAHLSLPNVVKVKCITLDLNSSLSTIISANPDLFYPLICAADRVEICGNCFIDPIFVHCYTGERERLCLGLVGSTPRQLRPGDIVGLFRDKAQVCELTVSWLSRRNVPGVEFRAFPHLIRLAICGKTADHVLLHLAPNVDEKTGAQLLFEDLCPALETLTVDFHRLNNRSQRLGTTLWNGTIDVAAVEGDLHERCAELERVLLYRAQQGAHKLTRVEFGCTDESASCRNWFSDGHDQEYLLDPAGPDWVSWRPIVEPLEKLVDGPVVFTGYRIFVSSQ